MSTRYKASRTELAAVKQVARDALDALGDSGTTLAELIRSRDRGCCAICGRRTKAKLCAREDCHREYERLFQADKRERKRALKGGAMSATGRGAERKDADFYPTPAGPILRLLDHVDLPGGEWLEPSAGEGHIIRTVGTARGDVRWTACELREECGPPLRSMGLKPRFGDFLQLDPSSVWPGRWHGGPFRVALGNPPFQLAQEFVEHALAMAEQVVFLLRLSFLESQKRESFFGRVGVPDVFVLPERPSFTGEGTDSCAYAWMRWQRGGTQEGRVRILHDKRQLSLPVDTAKRANVSTTVPEGA